MAQSVATFGSGVLFLLLLVIIRGSQIERTDEELYTGKDLDREDMDRDLRIAMSQNNEDRVRLLLKYGADVNRPYQDRSHLEYAVSFQKRNMFDILMEQENIDVTGCILPQPDKCWTIFESVFWWSMNANDTEMTKQLLDKGADPDEGNIPYLSFAIYKNNEDMLRLLLKHGADVNRAHKEESPLGYAVVMQVMPMVSILLAQPGMDVNCCVPQEPDPCWSLLAFALTWTVKTGDTDLARQLLSKGADPNHQVETCGPFAAKVTLGDAKDDETAFYFPTVTHKTWSYYSR
eukprot:GFUD01075938.1.p1 GENE.GFUD01075938.1~~GFUD01075938.1.p1  ORF type:complete len:298 (-),score=63.51 GFUD01075938.1:70-939(-)